MTSVLITGGAGFIGSRLAAALVGQGCRVTVADALHPQVHNGRGWPADLPSSVDRYICDVTHAADIEALLTVVEVDVVVHLAAETGTGQSLLESSRHGLVNVVGTTRLLDALSRARQRPSHLLLASSRAVYGEGRWETSSGESYFPSTRSDADLSAGVWNPRSPSGAEGRPTASTATSTPARPANIYAATKLAQEHLLQAWCASFSIPLSILRLQNVYGPGQSLTNSYTGVVSLFARLAREGESIPVYEDGEIIRDFVFVDDVVAAFTAAIHSPPEQQRVVDIGSGQPTTLHRVASMIAEVGDAPPPRVTGQFRAGDVRAAWCSNDEAERELSYRPAHPLHDGLRALYDWVMTQDGVR